MPRKTSCFFVKNPNLHISKQLSIFSLSRDCLHPGSRMPAHITVQLPPNVSLYLPPTTADATVASAILAPTTVQLQLAGDARAPTDVQVRPLAHGLQRGCTMVIVFVFAACDAGLC